MAAKPLNRVQPSIRSFFQPRLPTYSAPPAAITSNISVNGNITPASPPRSLLSNTQKLPAQPELLHTAPSTPLPPQASISKIHEHHVQPLRRINSLLLPINYPDSFYHKIIDPNNSPNFSRVILWQDEAPHSLAKVVGGVVCRIDQNADSQTSSLYIQSLSLLSPYRGFGLANAALADIIHSVVSSSPAPNPITSLYAHVWTENEEALAWYTARGFIREEPLVQGYYRRLNPGNAWIFRRPIAPSDYLRYPNTRPIPQVNTTTTSPPLPHTTTTSTLPPCNSFATPPPPPTLTARPGHTTSTNRATSYQTRGPGHEWNDLPEDILPLKPESDPSLRPSAPLFRPESTTGSNTGSTTSSRSSSSTRTGGKKKRLYPAAAFGPA